MWAQALSAISMLILMQDNFHQVKQVHFSSSGLSGFLFLHQSVRLHFQFWHSELYYLMYHHSRLVFCTLLTLYAMEVVSLLIYYVVTEVQWDFIHASKLKYYFVLCAINRWLVCYLCIRFWYCTNSPVFNLPVANRILWPHLAQLFACYYSDCSRHIDVSSHSNPVHQGITSNVQSNKKFPTQSLHEMSCEGWHDILYCVCPHPLSFPETMLMAHHGQYPVIFSHFLAE